MTYRGYQAKVELDEEAGVFHGEVIKTRDVITFQGTSVKQLKQAFEDSVDDYLEFCASRGEDPEKPFSGKFLVRVPPEVHRQIMTRPGGRAKARTPMSRRNWPQGESQRTPAGGLPIRRRFATCPTNVNETRSCLS
jgi:predicted HicB family RNase H-like nuclease